jgi:hypothetical protein
VRASDQLAVQLPLAAEKAAPKGLGDGPGCRSLRILDEFELRLAHRLTDAAFSVPNDCQRYALTCTCASGYRISMVGRSHYLSRIVMLLTVASTLLATWLPPVRVCAYGTQPDPVAQSPGQCPCCCNSPSSGEGPMPCCLAQQEADKSERGTCGCDSNQQNTPEPTAPPQPAETDDTRFLTTLCNPGLDTLQGPIGSSLVDVLAQLPAPPPTDLVISLSRITC